MAVNVREVVRDQVFLMPPSVAEWLPEDHLAWFVLDVVGELELSGFYSELRDDGRGGSSYDPSMMLGVLVYAYCVGERSSRRIEARLVEDVAFRVLAGNQCPDHATLARFRCRHEAAIAELFSQVLGLCVAEGLVAAGVVAIDGTKVEANASAWSNRTRRQIAGEILAEADATDAAEDERFGDRRGDELPERWVDRRDRPARLREALRQLDAEGASDWETYLAERARKEAETGRKLPGRQPSKTGRKAKDRPVNTTDPDSRMLRARNRFVQGYNAQAAASQDHIIVAAEMTNAANDVTQLAPLVEASNQNLRAAGVEHGVGTFVADAGYWSVPNATLETDAEVLIATVAPNNGITDPEDPRVQARHAVLERVERGELTLRAAGTEMGISDARAGQLLAARRAPEPEALVVRAAMNTKLASPNGTACYAHRKTTIEPIFGNLKMNLRFRRFSRRGLTAVTSEWRLICTVHNLLKIRRHQLALAPA
jgi:transposase